MLNYVVSRFGMKYRNNDEDFHSWLSRRIRTIVVISLVACLSVSYLQAGPEATNESQSLQAIIEAIKNTRPEYGTGRGIAHVDSVKNGANPDRTVVEFRFKDTCYRSDVFNVIDKQENELDFIYAVNTQNCVKYIGYDGYDGYVEASPGQWDLDFGTDFHPEVFNRWRGMSLDQILSSVLLVSKYVKKDISASIDSNGHLHFRAGGIIRKENASRFSSLEVVIDTNEGFRLLSVLRQQRDYRGLGSKSDVRYDLIWEKYGTKWYIRSAEYERNRIAVLDRMGKNPIEANESNEYIHVNITEFEPNVIIDDKEFTLKGLNLATGTKIYDKITGITYKYGGPVDVPAMGEVGSEQKKKDVASKEQKQEAGVTGARAVELTLHPAKAPEPAQKYQLLPKVVEQIDADAAPLYEKALLTLPKNFQTEQISQWLKTTPEKLPLKQVQSTLQQFNPIMELLKQAAKCKQCDWPYLDDDTISQNMREYRTLAFFLDLQMRIEIAQGQYDKAIGTLQTGFAMAKHLGEGPTLLQGIVGVGISGRMFRPLEHFIQGANAPNLYWALRDLPKPFIDLTEQSEFEDQDIRERAHLLMNRLDRNVAALQCIEAIRLYAAVHNGKLPNELSDITQVSVPDDPVMQKLIIYRRTGSKAFLEAPVAKGIADKYTFRYKLSLKE